MEWEAATCSGCGQPKAETFNIANDDRYTATVVVCHACAAIDRKRHVLSQTTNPEGPPMAGVMIAVQHDDDL